MVIYIDESGVNEEPQFIYADMDSVVVKKMTNMSTKNLNSFMLLSVFHLIGNRNS